MTTVLENDVQDAVDARPSYEKFCLRLASDETLTADGTATLADLLEALGVNQRQLAADVQTLRDLIANQRVIDSLPTREELEAQFELQIQQRKELEGQQKAVKQRLMELSHERTRVAQASIRVDQIKAKFPTLFTDAK